MIKFNLAFGKKFTEMTSTLFLAIDDYLASENAKEELVESEELEEENPTIDEASVEIPEYKVFRMGKWVLYLSLALVIGIGGIVLTLLVLFIASMVPLEALLITSGVLGMFFIMGLLLLIDYFKERVVIDNGVFTYYRLFLKPFVCQLDEIKYCSMSFLQTINAFMFYSKDGKLLVRINSDFSFRKSMIEIVKILEKLGVKPITDVKLHEIQRNANK